MRNISKVAPEWWDYTTLNKELLDDAAALTEKDIQQLAREGFTIRFYDTIEEFYLAEALEYITAWQQGTKDSPAGICGPIGPTEQLPLAARIVNELGISGYEKLQPVRDELRKLGTRSSDESGKKGRQRKKMSCR